MSKLKSLKPFIPAYIFALLILIGSSIPTYELYRLQRKSALWRIFLSDVFMHFAAFAFLTVLLSIGYAKAGGTKYWWIKAAAVSFFVGWLVEIIQIFLPYRSFSMRDIAVDLIAIFVALIVYATAKLPIGTADLKN
jgi:VanZ family protein